MNEPQPPIAARSVKEWIEVSIASGLPGPAGADGKPGPGAIVAGVQPPPPPDDGVLWINTADQGGAIATFTEDRPITFEGSPIQESEGEPLADIVPAIVAAIPVVVGGKRYLLPLIEE